MTTPARAEAEAIALDALEAAGVTGVTMFHIRCLAEFRRVMINPALDRYRTIAQTRMNHDTIFASFDLAHAWANHLDRMRGTHLERLGIITRTLPPAVIDQPRRYIFEELGGCICPTNSRRCPVHS